MTDPIDRKAVEEEFSEWFAQELAALEAVPPIIPSEYVYERMHNDRTGPSAKWLALDDELDRLYSLPVPENETERDEIADQIIDLERQQFEITGPTAMCGTCCLWHSEWKAIVDRRNEKLFKEWCDQLPPEERAALDRQEQQWWDLQEI